MNKPTDAQIKEFREWCGFRYEETTKQVCGVVTKCFVWKYPDSSWHEYLPSIDLNNLFKYAVPKAGDKGDLYYLLEQWITAIVFGDGDPTLALFWALWQVKGANNDR